MPAWVSKAKFGWKKKVRWSGMIQNNMQMKWKGKCIKDTEEEKIYTRS